MSEKDIERWRNAVTPSDKAPQPWTLGSGGSWDMLQVQPIPDAMLAELAQRYYYAGTPWNCRSMPLSPDDREYMYLLYTSMQGLVARMRLAEKNAASMERKAKAWDALMEMCGHWQDGSQTTVKIVQDDATCTCLIVAGDGKHTRRYFVERGSFEAAIAQYQTQEEL